MFSIHTHAFTIFRPLFEVLSLGGEKKKKCASTTQKARERERETWKIECGPPPPPFGWAENDEIKMSIIPDNSFIFFFRFTCVSHGRAASFRQEKKKRKIINNTLTDANIGGRINRNAFCSSIGIRMRREFAVKISVHFYTASLCKLNYSVGVLRQCKAATITPA